jgi:hypothetical protein
LAFSGCPGEGFAHFFGDGGDALVERGFVLGNADADAFAGVGVVCGVKADEEGFAGDDEGAARFEALVQGLRGDGQAGEPEPEEDRAFGEVDFQAAFEAV